MMVKYVTKFHKRHLRGGGILECVCVCVCSVSYRILSFERGVLHCSVLTWRGCIAHNN